jgi:hypothetical protein
MLFPIAWRECSVSILNLWMIEECTSKDDFERMTKIFESGEHLTDEANFNRVSALIFKLIER